MTRRRHLTMVLLTVFLITAWFLATLVGDSRPRLGLDLQGGISVVLFPVEGSDTSTLDTAVDVIRNRVDALGVVEPEVSRQGNTIVVDLPGAKNREQALKIIGQTAQLQFRLVCGAVAPHDPAAKKQSADEFVSSPNPECQAAPVASGATTTTTTATSTPTTAAGTPTTAAASTPTTAAAATTAPPASQPGQSAITPVPARGASEVGRPGQAASSTTAAPTTTTAAPTSTTSATTTPGAATTVAGGTTTTVPGTTTTTVPIGTVGSGVPTTPRKADVPKARVVLPCRDGACEGESQTLGIPDSAEALADQPRLILAPSVLSGEAVSKAKARFDGTRGWSVVVTFKGDDFVTKVAQPYENQRVAIVLDGVVQSAPNIEPGITGRDVSITGSFGQKEAKNLALVLRYGSLPVQFDPEQQTVRSVSPTLGKDQLQAGIIAGIVGLVLVAIYMTVFYRLLGLVVIAGLLLTGMVFFGLVTFLGNQQGLTLTLAGVTGLIVSVGITVDSYVVYFERLKDEARSGKTVRSSVDTGFRRAFRTIVAADLVSLFAALILWWLAEGSVRGFAFFLGLSTVIDLVLAYFFMHPLVSLMARSPRLVRMPGVGIAAGLDLAGAEL